MKLGDAAGLSALNIRKNPVRTLLTILGLGVGIGAILTVWTLGGAGQTQVEAEIARLGVDKVWITADNFSERTLQAEDGALVTAATGAPACAGAATLGAVLLGDTPAYAQLSGLDANAEEVHALHVETGRFFLPGEFLAGDTVTVVDHALAIALSPENPQALVGQRLTVGNRQMRVVGIVSDQTVQLLSACEGTAYMPLTTFLDTFGGQVQELTLSIPKGLQADAVAETALAALSAAGGDFDAMSLAEEIDAAKAVIRIFVMVLACVAAVCMFTGGIGVMNILLVSVRERRREIGVMKAVGGTSAQVGLLFLLEAASYAVLGGILGVALGGIMVRVFGGWIGLQAALTLETVLPTLAGATVLGLIFGVAPALRAARMVPVEALRQE